MENKSPNTDIDDELFSLKQAVNRLAVYMEKMKLAEYVALLENPRRLLWINFISGVARGLGIAIGFSVLFAFVVIILKQLVTLNLPLIGDFIAQIVTMVQESEKLRVR